MKNINKREAVEFAKAFRSASESKLGAADLAKLKKPLYKDYLLHVKKCANSKPAISNQDVPKILTHPPHISATTSHYYCQNNELLSLKQFIILMEQSQKRTKRDEKIKQREQQKREVQQFQKNIQYSNLVNLRMTSNFVKRAISMPKNSMM